MSDRLRAVGLELAVADEQLSHLAGEADDARLRALVSETPLAEHDKRAAERHAQAMRRHRDDLAAELRKLEVAQDDLLDRFSAAAP